MKKKAYMKPTMMVYDLPNLKPLLTTSDPSDPDSVPGLPGWPYDFG